MSPTSQQESLDLRNRRKAEGKCMSCGKRKALPGRINCHDCAKRANERQKAYLARSGRSR